MPTVHYDMISGNQVRDTVDGVIIVRPCKIVGIPVFPGMSDATVLTRCLGFLPSLFDFHPDVANFPLATLRERNVRSVPAVNQAIIDLIYRAPGASDWSLEEITQSEYKETFATANGSAALVLWYKKGEPSTTTTAPSDSDKVAGSTQKAVPKRVLRARGIVSKAVWAANKTAVRAAIGKINKLQWGPDTTEDIRGKWLFSGLMMFTNDFGRTYRAELFFVQDHYGHYPVRAYLNIHGEHPPDSATEDKIRALAPPPEGGSITLNGIGMFSIYTEVDFNNVFLFTPF